MSRYGFGPIWSIPDERTKINQPHEMPSGYWKIIAALGNSNISLAAFILDQETRSRANFFDFQTTVLEVEERSGLDFYSSLGAEEQEVLETSKPTLTTGLGCG